MSEQDDFFHDVERAVAEHRRMNIAPEIPQEKGDEQERTSFLAALHELNTLPKEELARRWAKVQQKFNKGGDRGHN
jgi:hypothetical protein